jgi:ABC-2 type transport system ATP-binding protein
VTLVGEPAIRVDALTKRYGAVEALRGVSFEVAAGEVFALLGPNGAGKTTTVEILEGYRKRDGGGVSVLGLDPASGGRRLRERIGIVLQTPGVYPFLSPREAVRLFASYYPSPRDPDETLALVGLSEHADRRVRGLSGGQRRRLDLALALVGDPDLLFLDEPTTGFDPEARRAAWDTIRGLQALGKTILLTTHYLDEVEALADRVAVLRGGRVIAENRPEALGAADARVDVRFRLPPGVEPPDLGPLLRLRTVGTYHEGTAADPVRALHALTAWALEHEVTLAELEVRRPRLEDVYLGLTAEPEEARL